MSEVQLNVTSLSQYVRLENCDRYLRLRLRKDEEKALLKRWELTIQPLTPLLKDSGAEFEAAFEKQLVAGGENVVDMDNMTAEDTRRYLREAREPTVLLQAPLEGPLGAYTLHGLADAVRLERDRKGRLNVLVADLKASRKERAEHRIQVAAYAHMLQHMVGEEIVLRGTVLHIQEDGSIPPLDAAEEGFDLDTYLGIMNRLVADEDSTINAIAAQPFEDVSYHLGYKCDGCAYNAICMYDTAERMDLSLTPYMSATEKRVLLEAGVRTTPELAELVELPERGSGLRELRPAQGRESKVSELSNRWPVGPSLPLLVQHARQACRQSGLNVNAAPFMHGAGFGTLPHDEEHPELVKVFFDAQQDYLKDRVYLLSALVTGPAGESTIVRMTDGPPTEEAEQELLVNWVAAVAGEMHAVAAEDRASVHLYCYNRYDQKVLLETLKRKLEAVASVPAFFDLLTQSPALEQSIISFLSDELQERANLGVVCTPLHAAARCGAHARVRLERRGVQLLQHLPGAPLRQPAKCHPAF